ncbi:MAG: hypothetical protein ABIU95_14545, partial [Burkholderiales bacterium]
MLDCQGRRPDNWKVFAHPPHAEDHPDLHRPDFDRRRALGLVVGASVLAMLASVAEAAPFTRG